MKKFLLIVGYIGCFGFAFSQKATKIAKLKLEVETTERNFEKMCLEKGITNAFHFYADSNAVINRGSDSLIYGKEAIRHFYEKKNYTGATVKWKPDFIEVSGDGTLAYTYGNYVWKLKKEDGSVSEFTGIFHTVWKKQKDGSWKYVWD